MVESEGRSTGHRFFAPNMKLPPGTNAKLPSEVEGEVSCGKSAKMPRQRISAAERLRRLEEAKAFLRAHLSACPQPARTLLRAARAAGIATRTLHRAKDALGIRPERSGGYGAHGQWTWYPPEAGGQARSPSVALYVQSGEHD